MFKHIAKEPISHFVLSDRRRSQALPRSGEDPILTSQAILKVYQAIADGQETEPAKVERTKVERR